MPRTYIFLGPPGSGKDTQAMLLRDNYGFKILSPGELLREEVEAGTELGKQVEATIDAGELVADASVDAITRQRLQQWSDQHVVITGSPRRFHQMGMIDKMLQDLGRELTQVVYLRVSDRDVIERLSGRLYAPQSDRTYHEKFNPPKVAGKDDETGEELIKRDDDQPMAVSHRLEIFHKDTQPLAEEYEKRGILTSIDGGDAIDEVHQRLVRELKLNGIE